MTAREIADIVHGELNGAPDLLITQAPTLDSRETIPGSIFLAIKGEHVDGHDFAQEAISRGASIVLATRNVGVPSIIVSDVQIALGLLAQHVREVLKDMTVIGITGSQGKTTTKDLLAWILGLAGSTVATTQSFNNELGAPITLLRCDINTKYCVLEMGARHLGDIAALCKIAQPNIGVVLNVGTAHIGEFGDQRTIARTKFELLENLDRNGVAIVGRYDALTLGMLETLKSSAAQAISFGESNESDVRATDIEIREGRAYFDLVTKDGREAVALRLVGEHQVANALAAASVCTALHIPIDVIATGLSMAEMPSHWRMEVHDLPNLLLINDSYNANPESTIAALRTLALFAQERGGQSWAFLGKMQELGGDSESEHARVGKFAEEVGIDNLVCVNAPEYGQNLFTSDLSTYFFSLKSEALSIAEHISEGDVVLIKGSRAEKMEELSEALIHLWLERKIVEQ